MRDDYKVIVLTGHRTLESGGVGTHLRLLDRELSRSGLRYELLLGRSKVDMALARASGLLGLRYGGDAAESAEWMLFIFGLVARLRGALARLGPEEPAVIHCHDRNAVLAAHMLRAKRPLAIVQTAHAPYSEQYLMQGCGPLLAEIVRGLERGSLAACESVIAVDQLEKAIALEKNPELDVEVIANAVDYESLRALASRPPAKQGGKPYVVVARHLHRKCGVHVAIEAFARSKHRQTHELWLVGSGPEEAALRSQVGAFKLDESVRFSGRLPNAEALEAIRNARVSLVPSVPVGRYIEATSLTMLESMALGVPLVASDIGGLHDVLSPSKAGILVPPGEAGLLAEAMDLLLEDEGARARQVERGLQTVRDQYSTGPWFARTRLVYERALGRREAALENASSVQATGT